MYKANRPPALGKFTIDGLELRGSYTHNEDRSRFTATYVDSDGKYRTVKFITVGKTKGFGHPNNRAYVFLDGKIVTENQAQLNPEKFST